MILLRFQSESGESFQGEPTSSTPLGFDDLLRALRGQDIDLEATARNVLVNGRSNLGAMKIALRGLVTRERSTIFALVRGGWLPPPFVIPRRFLVDQNVVIDLERIRRGTSQQELAELDWWLDLLTDAEATFNPLLYAMEGRTRGTPTFESFVEDFRQGAAAIAAALPQVSVVRFEATHYRAAFEKLEVLASRSNREAAFLVEAVPLILQQVSTSGVRRVEDRIMAIARDCGVLACSLVVIAALSCLYEDASSQAILVGRKLIKPAARYRSSDAYNAVADLKHLELLAMAQALNEIPPTSLCTRDAGLALFWTALSPQWAGESGLDPQCEVMLDPRLFPRLDEEGLRQLSTQLAGAR